MGDMKSELKEEWLRALRSGEYKQARGALHRMRTDLYNAAEGHCCLGVLCEVVGVRKGTTINGVHEWYGSPMYTGVPSDNFLKRVGLSESHTDALVSLNDDSNSYEPTIKYIEENL